MPNHLEYPLVLINNTLGDVNCKQDFIDRIHERMTFFRIEKHLSRPIRISPEITFVEYGIVNDNIQAAHVLFKGNRDMIRLPFRTMFDDPCKRIFLTRKRAQVFLDMCQDEYNKSPIWQNYQKEMEQKAG